ncbi:hypothetical protein M378DRAFT_84088 [Amanita muscaria Koide BX008]|uniref:Phosphatidylserine decarboxylase proenzyme 1, mitochondrial n=1 Tax=Amanita muscaria (strain Koide BX008) TaxID=946122 RepID=A0A0C2WTS6_AMAMK|nr:hypothetical protein M378DRAFT_84088 [Amanita muscaria Koide BX008]
MYLSRISRKHLFQKSKEPFRPLYRPLYGASSRATTAFARCWTQGTNRTSALIKSVGNVNGLKTFKSLRGNGFRRGIMKRAAYYSYYSTSTSSSSGGGREQEKFHNGPSPGTGAASSVSLYRKIIASWNETPIKWYPLPIAVGALLLVAIQYRKKVRQAQKEVHVDEHGIEVVKLKGPWHVHVLGALPLRNLSRLWGYVNSFELPVWFRPYGFKFYAFAFGCNLDEIEQDLTAYRSLGEFFYRKLKPGVRPVDDAVLVSPADGTILHLGTITDSKVEQVKGITYSLDALLGVDRPSTVKAIVEHNPDMEVVDDQEFANVNGIEYTLGQLLGGNGGNSSPGSATPSPSASSDRVSSLASSPPMSSSTSAKKNEDEGDASVVEPNASIQDTLARDVSLVKQVGISTAKGFAPGKPKHERRGSSYIKNARPGHSLFFSVIYLAPGDYHRFHSPTAWVVEKRRHFVGELFSVSPWMAKRLEGLFVLNERVSLLGRWRYGFFGMVPVGATNVGSIVVNFDQNLRTNVRGRKPPPGTYNEAVYSSASKLLNGQPLTHAQEMGGFKLGSTIVLVFEAPDDFEFTVRAGQKVKVGQKMGDVPA